VNKKMTEGTRALILNVGVILGLIWCYAKGYPPKIILGSGIFLLVFANILLSFRRRRSGTPN